MSVILETTVGQLVVEKPARARIFERFGIDYCCGGKVPLKQAITAKGLSPDAVLAELARDQAADAQRVAQRNWATASLTDLCDHIEQTHHAYLKEELPRLAFLTGKVANHHGGRRPALVEIHETFLRFQAELQSHMVKEEQVLFPICRALDAAEQPRPTPSSDCGSVKHPIAAMVREHEDAGEALACFRELTNDFTPPADACNTWHAMYDALHQLERDMHEHVHKENNILFPKATRVEKLLSR